jgi:hypothetical protein
MPANELFPAHEETLRNSAIDPNMVRRWGIYSVRTPGDLPDAAVELGSHVPGLLFSLPDPNCQITYQIRADDPPEHQGKYRFPSGEGNILVCWPPMQQPLSSGDYDTVVLVEGTKQCLALTCLAPTKTLVLGISGCFGWKSIAEPDEAVEGLSEITEGKTVYVIFDADIRTNKMVNEAAVGLHEYLTTEAHVKEVRWITLSDPTAKEGLDDYLAKVPEDRRLKSYRELIRRSVKNVPTLSKPGERHTSLQGFTPNEELMAFTKLISAKDGAIIGEEVFFNALVRISESMTVVNDLIRQADGSPKHLGVRVTLEVRSQVLGDESSYITIPYDELRDFEAWVQRLPRGAAASILMPAPGKPTSDLVNTIKMYRADERNVVTGYARLGWTIHQEQPYYLYSGGAIGPNGNTDAVRGVLEGPASKVRFRDLMEIAPTLVESVRASFSPIRFLHKPALWKTLVGANAFVTAGFEPKGMLFFFGEPGSGKTHLAQGATSFYSPDYAPEHEIMASLEGTDNAITSLTVGFHNAFLLFDDAHPVKNQNKREKQYDMIDSLSRIAYSGGSVGKMRGRWDSRTQSMKQAEVSADRPFIMITAEFQPYGEDARSQLERMFLVRIRETDTFYSLEEADGEIYPGFDRPMKGAHALESLGERGILNDAMAGYIQWIANQMMEYANSPETVLTDWKDKRLNELAAAISTDFPEDGTRLRENVRTYLVGWIMWLNYATDIGAITGEEAMTYLESYRVELRQMIEEYKKSALDKTTYGFQQIIDSIVAREAAGELVIARSWKQDEDSDRRSISAKPNAITVGSYVRARGSRGDGVAIILPLLASSLRQDATLLAQMLDRNGVEKGYVFNLNNKKVRGWFIPKSLWIGEETGSNDNEMSDESTL